MSFATAATLFVSATATGLHGMSTSVTLALEHYARAPKGAFSHPPLPAYLGKKPGRSPKTRGGLWNTRSLEVAAIGDGNLFASMQKPIPSHTTAISAEPGSSLPWEGSVDGTNTGNGNKLTTLNLLSWTNRGGLPVEFTMYHNSQSSYNAELGEGWSWSYDIFLNLATSNPVVRWQDGTSIPYTLSLLPGGGYTAPAGISDTLVKNVDNTWTLTKKDGVKYQFNVAGFLVAIQDRNANQITITRNTLNIATKVQDSTGRYYDITLNGSNNFQSITDHTGRTWSFTLNSEQMAQVTWPTLDSVVYKDIFTYVGTYDIGTWTNRRGKVWTYTYNPDSSLASETNPLGKTWTYTYASSYTRITNPLGKYIQHNYSSGKLVSVTDESGYSESYTTRDANNNVTTTVDKRGKTWTSTFDSKNNLLTQTNPLAKTWTTTYNSFSQPLTVTTPLGNVTTLTYDANGNHLTTTNALSDVIETNTYGTYGLRATTTNALNKTTTFTYDSHGQPNTITDPLSHATTIVVDSLGRVTSKTNALSETESVAYDVWGRAVTFTNPDSTTRTVTYNAVNQVTAQTDELSHTKSYVYDNAGRMTSFTNGRGDVESYGYDDADRRTSVTNGRSKTRTYTYSDRGDQTSLTMPDGAVETWTYAGTGQAASYTNPKNETILYPLDNAGRRTGIDYPTGTDVTFGYDNDDRQTSMVDSTGTTTWTLDPAGQATTLATPQGTLTYVFDDAGRKTSMTDATGTTTYGYDDASRLTSVLNPHSETTTYEYDDANRLTYRRFANGQYTGLTYDSRGRQTWAKHKDSVGVFASDFNVYDDAGRLTSKTVSQLSTNITTTFTYDDADQLTGESKTGYTATYTYDGNGNRLTKTVGGVTQTYAYDDGDKLTGITQGGTTVRSYGYDAAGRTTSVTSSAGTTTLGYDYEGRVTGITYPGSGTNSFAYNGLDTLVSKVDSTGIKTYRRNGVGVTSPVLSDGSATYTPGVSQRQSGSSTWDMLNHLGTATLQSNASGTTTATRTYDAFGLMTASTGTPKGPFGFAALHGYQEDGDSGLKLVGHRYYDAYTGRFITRDPIKDGRNWYAYCDNNPIDFVDDNGLEKNDISQFDPTIRYPGLEGPLTHPVYRKDPGITNPKINPKSPGIDFTIGGPDLSIGIPIKITPGGAKIQPPYANAMLPGDFGLGIGVGGGNIQLPSIPLPGGRRGRIVIHLHHDKPATVTIEIK
jgi:RHS repeat-associated protein